MERQLNQTVPNNKLWSESSLSLADEFMVRANTTHGACALANRSSTLPARPTCLRDPSVTPHRRHPAHTTGLHLSGIRVQ
jgi:hypothetical protein